MTHPMTPTPSNERVEKLCRAAATSIGINVADLLESQRMELFALLTAFADEVRRAARLAATSSIRPTPRSPTPRRAGPDSMKNKKRNERISPARTTGQAGGVAPGSQFWVLDPESPGENESSCTATGPFATVDAAEKYLVEDAVATFEHADERICDAVHRTDRHWARPVMIAQVIKRVQQVPTVTIGCDILPANTAICHGRARP